MEFTTDIKVRGYELDSFGHVNNANYLSYFEHARWEILNGTDLLTKLRDQKLFLVVVEANVKYLRELLINDEITIKTTIRMEPPYMIYKHILFNKNTGRLSSKASIKTLLIDENRLAVDYPPELLKITE